MTQKDRIILIASDGVWEFLQNDELVNMIAPFYEGKKI
jgi:serine/threonine protein phosphatase PrpC